MYKSPIEIVKTVSQQMIKREEEMILKAIVNCGVQVDKEELIKALEYDRRQYDKGFRDGAIEFAERLKNKLTSCAKTIDGKHEYLICDSDIDNLVKETGVMPNDR
jgi:hypothetical protein